RGRPSGAQGRARPDPDDVPAQRDGEASRMTAVAAPEQASSGKTYLRLVGMGALIGIPAALVAALFLAAVHGLESVLWPDKPAWYLVLGLPVIGAAIVLLARRLLPGDGGHDPLQGIGGGATPLRNAP